VCYNSVMNHLDEEQALSNTDCTSNEELDPKYFEKQVLEDDDVHYDSVMDL